MTLTIRHVLEEYKHIHVKVGENMMFYSFDLDLDPMTLKLILDLDMVKMYLHTHNEVPSFSGSKVIAWTDRHTDRQTSRLEWNYNLSAYADGKNSNWHLLAGNEKTFDWGYYSYRKKKKFTFCVTSTWNHNGKVGDITYSSFSRKVIWQIKNVILKFFGNIKDEDNGQ